MIPTADPTVFIEEQRPGYVRYRSATGRRWEVHGTCDRRGNCLIGAVIDGVEITSHADLEALGRERADSELDVPVTPEFDTCCGSEIFRYVEFD